jgi:hypothetical protein
MRTPGYRLSLQTSLNLCTNLQNPKRAIGRDEAQPQSGQQAGRTWFWFTARLGRARLSALRERAQPERAL